MSFSHWQDNLYGPGLIRFADFGGELDVELVRGFSAEVYVATPRPNEFCTAESQCGMCSECALRGLVREGSPLELRVDRSALIRLYKLPPCHTVQDREVELAYADVYFHHELWLRSLKPEA